MPTTSAPRLQPRRPAARARAYAETLAPSKLEIGAIAGVTVAYLLAFELFGPDCYVAINLVGPLAMSTVLLLGGWGMLKMDGRNLWTALCWFRLSTSAYFGLGTLAVFAVNTYTRLYMEAFHHFFDDEIYKMNLVVTLSVLLALSAARLAVLGSAKPPRRSTGGASGGSGSLLALGLLFLAIGLTVNYGLKVPYELGYVNEEVPGSVLSLTHLTMVGVFMLTLWSLGRAWWAIPIITILVAIEMLLQLLLFAKAGILLTLILFLLAFLWHRITIKRLLCCAAIVSVAYALLQPLVIHAREELERTFGEKPQVGFTQRLELMSSYFAGTRASSEPELQGGLARMSYVNGGTFLIRQYDMGIPGEWPKLLPALFVPRLLWPDKPNISDIGRDIYELGTGRRTSSSGVGVFVEAYWAMGWWGVVLFMPIYGAILGILTATTARILREERWIYFPFVLLAMLCGFRTDGHYILDVAGLTGILIAAYIALSAAEAILSHLRRPPVARRRPSRDAGSCGITGVSLNQSEKGHEDHRRVAR